MSEDKKFLTIGRLRFRIEYGCIYAQFDEEQCDPWYGTPEVDVDFEVADIEALRAWCDEALEYIERNSAP